MQRTDTDLKSIAILSGGAIGLFLARRFFKGGQFTEKVCARGKVAVVTGGNTGIGLETVYMLCRSEQRAASAKEQLIKSCCDSSNLIYINCDLGNKENIRECAEKLRQIETHIDILVNNAGLMMSRYEKTDDGHEKTWGTNYIGPFLLTELLLPLLEKAEEGRIVNVSSIGHERSPPLDLTTIDDQDKYNSWTAYCKSKLANIMHARELTRRLRDRGNTTVTINAIHPGGMATEIFRDVIDTSSVKWMLLNIVGFPFMFFLKTWKDGAQTSLYCALSTELKGVSGQYFKDCARQVEAPVARDEVACKQLYDYSLKVVGLV